MAEEEYPDDMKAFRAMVQRCIAEKTKDFEPQELERKRKAELERFRHLLCMQVGCLSVEHPRTDEILRRKIFSQELRKIKAYPLDGPEFRDTWSTENCHFIKDQ